MSCTQRELLCTINTLCSELRATEESLAHWRAHAGRLHAQVRTLRKAPDETNGAPRSMLPLGHVPRRERSGSISSVTSFASNSTYRHARAPTASPTEAAVAPFLQNLQHMLNPKEAELSARRTSSATLLQTGWRGARQRRQFHAARAFFGIVNGVVELRSSGRSVPAYTITVVRGGHCWQVSHRFSDWIELDRQLTGRLPTGGARPTLPSRYPFRSSRITAYRQFALNTYLQGLLPLVEQVPPARRLLLNFLSRSHMHWLYAGDAVPFTPPTAAVCLEQRAEVARRLADNALWRDRNERAGGSFASGYSRPQSPTAAATNGHAHHASPQHGNGWLGGGGGYAVSVTTMDDGEVRDVSSGTTAQSAAMPWGGASR